jgi:hypothetical protein
MRSTTLFGAAMATADAPLVFIFLSSKFDVHKNGW